MPCPVLCSGVRRASATSALSTAPKWWRSARRRKVSTSSLSRSAIAAGRPAPANAIGRSSRKQCCNGRRQLPHPGPFGAVQFVDGDQQTGPVVGEVIGQCGQLGPQVGSVVVAGGCQVSPPRWNGNATAVSLRPVDADSSSAAATSGSRWPASRSISPGTAVSETVTQPRCRACGFGLVEHHGLADAADPVYRVARPGRRDLHRGRHRMRGSRRLGRRAGVG